MARLQYRVNLTSEKLRSLSVITNGSGETVEGPKRFRSSELDRPVLIVGGLHRDAFGSLFNDPPDGCRLVRFELEADLYHWKAVFEMSRS